MTFQIHALRPEPFAAYFAMSPQELQAAGARRVVADTAPGFPCRVSLADAQVGETLVLVNHAHLTGPTPYAASHAIYVREGVDQAQPAPDEVPAVLASRLLSVRGFDENALMQDAEVVEGAALAAWLNAAFERPEIAFVDVHNARQGCFAARVTRAGVGPR